MSDDPIQPEAPRQMLSIEKVLALIPVGRTTLYRMERDGRFPKSYYVTSNRRFWYEDEIVAWQSALPNRGFSNRP